MSKFQDNIISIYDAKGKAWLDRLPEQVARISKGLGLHNLKEVTNLSYNYVLSGFRGNHPIILKLGLDTEALKREALALKYFAGYGAVKVLAEDNGVLLLEQAVPGISLKSYFSNRHSPAGDDKAIEIACNVMKKLQQAEIPECNNFPHIKDCLSALDKEWDLPSNYLQKARRLRDQLLKMAGSDVLLHGDLHHDNILQNGDDWVVIDPKGVIGSPMNEVWAI